MLKYRGTGLIKAGFIGAVLIGGVATELLRGDSFFGLINLPKPGDLVGPARHALAEKVGDEMTANETARAGNQNARFVFHTVICPFLGK